jgi:hypothetical protein
VVGYPSVVSSATNLAVQDVQDYYQQTEKEQDTEQQPLARSLLQFAAVHGRTRLRAQRHRSERWGRGTNPTLHARAKSTYRSFRARCGVEVWRGGPGIILPGLQLEAETSAG